MSNREIDIVRLQNSFLEEIGLWKGFSSQGLSNREKYSFRLSPDSLELTARQRLTLEEINDLMFADGGFLDGSMRLFRRTFNPRFTSTKVGGRIARTLWLGIPKEERAIQRIFQTQVPAITKVDLAISAASEPAFKILEVETDQAHGFGYATIADRFGRRVFSDRDRPQGLITTLKALLTQRSDLLEKPLALIVGRLESFYEGELGVFARMAEEEGLNVMVIPERELVVSAAGVASCNSRSRITDFLVDLPILTPAGRIGTSIDSDNLLDLYARARIECLLPPKRFLSNKGLLGLISNSDSEPELERVLTDVFAESKLSRLRRFIPFSVVINRKTKNFVTSQMAGSPESWVIKKTVASGSKGVALPNSPDRQRDLLQEALVNPFSCIIQENIDQQIKQFHFAEQMDLENLRVAPMYTRLTLFVSPVGIAAVALTARETPDVHGSRDCIQIPVVYTDETG